MSLLNDLQGITGGASPSGLANSLDVNSALSQGGLDLEAVQSLDPGSLSGDVQSALPDVSSETVDVPSMPEGLSSESFMGNITGIFDKIGNVNFSSIVDNIGSNPLPVDLNLGDFGFSGIMDSMASGLSAGPSFSGLNMDIPGLDPGTLSTSVGNIARGVGQSPMAILNMMIGIYKQFVNILTDDEKLREIAVSSFTELYEDQVKRLNNIIPLGAINGLKDMLRPERLLNPLRNILDSIQVLDKSDVEQVKAIAENINNQVIPYITAIKTYKAAIENFAAGTVQKLEKALGDVLDLAAEDEVFLQPYFTRVENAIGGVLDSILSPVQSLANAAGSINDGLNSVTTKIEDVVTGITTKIKETVDTVEGYFTQAEEIIRGLEEKAMAFLDKINVDTIVQNLLTKCRSVGDSIEGFFDRMEQLKQKLNSMALNSIEDMENKVREAFDFIKTKIEEVLSQITALLEKPEVVQVLDKAREGIETFRSKLEEISFKPVFDLVIDKTVGIETQINGLDTASMGTPQKMGLKLCVKVLEEVKIDEYIKPEILEAFKLIQEPVGQVVDLIKGKLDEIYNMIYQFNPGTLVTEFIKEGTPYMQVIDTIEQYKPSVLLAPVKAAFDQFASLLDTLDPNIVVSQLEGIYENVRTLTDIINPANFTGIIDNAIGKAKFQLTEIRDNKIPDLVNVIKENISLERLLEGNPLQDLTNSDFWQTLVYYLSGRVLDDVNVAITNAFGNITSYLGSVDLSPVFLEVSKVINNIDNQLAVGASFISSKVEEVQQLFSQSNTLISELESRRANLQAELEDIPQLAMLLEDVSLLPLVDCGTQLTAMIELDEGEITALVQPVLTALQAKVDNIKALTQDTVKTALPAILNKQIRNPLTGLVTGLKTRLSPLTDAITAVESIIETVLALPAIIDTNIDNVINTVSGEVTDIINSALSAIDTFESAITGVITEAYNKIKDLVTKFSPAWLINAFTANDFNGSVVDGTPAMLKQLAIEVLDASSGTIEDIIKSGLSTEELGLLEGDRANAGLTAGNLANLLRALNAVLVDSQGRICRNERFNIVKGSLQAAATAKENTIVSYYADGRVPTNSEIVQLVEDSKDLYQYKALLLDLDRTKAQYNPADTNPAVKIRLARLILEAYRPDAIKMGYLTLFNYIKEQIKGIYPTEVIDRVDDFFLAITGLLRQAPDQFIRQPLDDAFNKLRNVIATNFDITDIFETLSSKIDGLDEDLGRGLDSLSVAYNRLLRAFDTKLSS